MDRPKLVVCAVFQNEAAWLPEFIAYHRIVGVDHVVLYDTGSTDDPARAIRHSPIAAHATLIAWPQRPARTAAYRHFIDNFASGYEWAAFIDTDDFLLPLNGGSVVDTLDRLGSEAAVLVQRRVFGPPGWRETPWGLVIECHDRRAADDFPGNRHVRSIVRCSTLQSGRDDAQAYSVVGPVFNTAGQPAVNSPVQPQPCYQNLVINHYAARSREDWLAKARRDAAAANAPPPHDDPASFERFAALCPVRDVTIQAFASAVRDLLGLGSAAGTPAFGVTATALPASGVPASGVPGTVAAPATPPGAQPAPPKLPGVTVAVPIDVTPSWIARGADAQERADGLGMVFFDRSRRGGHWLAALRGTPASMIDPCFLLDEFDRIRDFPTDAQARAACDAALAAYTVPAHTGPRSPVW